MYEKRIKHLIRVAHRLTYIDKLSLRNAISRKYYNITKVRDLIVYIVMEEYPEKEFKYWIREFPSLKNQTKRELEIRVHRNMNGKDDYIDLYLKLKHGK